MLQDPPSVSVWSICKLIILQSAITMHVLPWGLQCTSPDRVYYSSLHRVIASYRTVTRSMRRKNVSEAGVIGMVPIILIGVGQPVQYDYTDLSTISGSSFFCILVTHSKTKHFQNSQKAQELFKQPLEIKAMQILLYRAAVYDSIHM